MHLRSYFCQTCGRGYNLHECIRDGNRLYCVDCSKGKIVMGGWPFLLISMFLLLASTMSPKHITGWSKVLSFGIPAVGLFLAGLLRFLQEYLVWRKNHTNPSRPESPAAPPQESDDESELDRTA